MYEVEVKVRAPHDEVREALADAGADEEETVTQADTYYNAPHRDFAETDEALRVRRETRAGETEARITYKGPLVETASKTREEIETGVESGDDAGRIFEALGFDPVETVTKKRTRYSLEGYTITLDYVEGAGEFVEVETGAEEANVESAREGAYRLLRDLGLDPSEQIRTSYLGMLLGEQ